MKLDKETTKRLRISTAGMAEIRLGIMIKAGYYEYPDEVKAFIEGGKLPNVHGESGASVYFIQREDGYLAVGKLSEKLPAVNNLGIAYDPSIKAHLKPGVATNLIVAKVDPVCVKHHEKLFLNSNYGPLAFLSVHHPDEHSREIAWGKMAEVLMATESEEEKAAFTEVWKEQADKLGINYAQANSSLAH